MTKYLRIVAQVALHTWQCILRYFYVSFVSAAPHVAMKWSSLNNEEALHWHLKLVSSNYEAYCSLEIILFGCYLKIEVLLGENGRFPH